MAPRFRDLAIGGLLLAMTGAAVALAQAPQNPEGGATPADRARNTREFLGLGPEPDKAAAARGAPLFASNCAFCHGAQARGAEGPSLIVSDVVLGDDHGEKLAPFLEKGRPDKGMPSFATLTSDQRRDIAEFLHQQVEDVANRGTYKLPNVLVGDAGRGKVYFAAHCATCHAVDKDLRGIGAKFRSVDDLQKGWVWPSRGPADGPLAITAVVTSPAGTVSGRVTQISDFKVTLVDAKGETRIIPRGRDVRVTLKDPLAPHLAMIPHLADSDMHDVTAYLETQK